MAYIDPDLPDELQAGQPRAQEEEGDTEALLAALGITIAGMREEAISARKGSGIEDVWMACEEAYLGIDDANRHEFAAAKWAKPTSMAGPLTSNSQIDRTKSTAFVRLTSRYVDMGAAKVSEIVLPIDDKAFSIVPTPVPDLIATVDDKTPLMDNGKQVYRPLGNGEPAPANPQPHGMVPATVGDMAKATMDQAKDSAEKAETRIYDWMVEAKYPLEMRKVMYDSARLGAGILKSPYPQMQTSWAREKGKLKKKTKIVPGMRSTSPWNFYPDGACGENIHDGDYTFEVDNISSVKLKKLKEDRTSKGIPIYIGSQIDKVLDEGPGKCNLEVGNPNERAKNAKKKPFQIWYFHGVVKRSDMQLMGAVLDDLPTELTEVNAVVTLVNDSVIRAAVNPLESGHFPYRVHNWSRRDGHWSGVGVGEQVTMPQRTVNAATRALLNNAGISAGGQIVMDRTQIDPADGSWALVPNKIWWFREGATSDDVRKIFMTFQIPNMGPQLQAVIDYGFKLAEEISNIPLVTQGQQADNSPDTFGQAQLQNTNAHTLLRSIAHGIDDAITEPVVNDLYEWLLLDDDVPEEEKGEWIINAKGSISMVEKAIQEQVLLSLIQAAANPAFGINPKKLIEEYLKAKRLDPRKIQYSDEETAQMQSQPPTPAPVVQAAQIKAQSALQVEQTRSQGELQAIQAQDAQEQQNLLRGNATPHMAMATARIEQERIRASTAQTVEASRAYAEEARAQKELEIAQQNGQFEIQKMALQKELALLQYAHDNQMKLADVKTELANTAMNNQTKKELASAELQLAQSESDKNRGVDLHKHTASLQRDMMTTPVTP